jgi:uncharacterized protein (UPF0548 family)
LLSLRKPSGDSISSFLIAQAKLEFTYSAVGATAEKLPAGYAIDHTRVKLGEGAAVFEAARAALQRWEQFRLGWLEALSAAGWDSHPLEIADFHGVVSLRRHRVPIRAT